MKRSLLTLFLALLLSSLNGQNNPGIQVSSDTVRQEGVLFYRHKVQKGETIFSICRVYRVDAEQLVKDNPKLMEGLKEGDLLHIRKSEAQQKRYVKYIVKWFDNLQTIADQFHVSPEEIIALNSLTDAKVKTRQELILPYKEDTAYGNIDVKMATVSQKASPSKKESAVKEEIINKKVTLTEEKKVPSEKKIKAEKSEPVKQNPETRTGTTLTEQKGIADQQKEKVTEPKERVIEQKRLTPPALPVKGDTIEEFIAPPEGTVERHATVSLILPFGQPEKEAEYSGNNYLDFYQGFLIAAKEMKDEGMSLDLNVLDISDYPSGAVLAQTGALDNSDLVIGPVFLNEIEEIIGFTSEKDIPLVSPMDTKSEYLAQNNPLFFQVGISLYNQQVNLLKSLSRGSQVTLIYEEAGSDTALVKISKEILNDLGVRYTSLYYNLLSGREIGPRIVSRLSDSKLNEIVVLSNSEAFVSDVLRNLNLLSTRSGYKISLYGTPKWRNFDNVDISYYHSMNLHLSMQYYVDYESSEVKDFLEEYRNYFSAEPSPYSFQGYDLGKFFLGNILRYGSRFIRRIDGQREHLLQSDIMFRRDGRGFVNSESRLIIYNPDYSVKIRRFFSQP